MEIPKRITFIDVRDKKYVLPVKLIAEDRLEPFLKHAPPREKDSTSDDAIFKFPDSPDTIEIMVQVLQHGEFYRFPRWEKDKTILGNLLNAVRVGEKYHVYDLVQHAADLFDDNVKHHQDYFPEMDYGYTDFTDTVFDLYDLYGPDLPEGWQKMTPGELFFSRRAPNPDSCIPLLKRWAVQFAADNYHSIAYEEDCMDLFGENGLLYPDGLHPFHKDVKKAMKKQKDIRTKSKGKKSKMDEEDWSDFFTDERYVTLADRKHKRYLLTRRDVLDQSTFLYERAPKAYSLEYIGNEEYHFHHEIYELPDHPHGVRAIAAMIDDGPRYFDVPDDVQDKDLSIQYLAHALAAGDKYGILSMREAVEGLLRCCDYLARCRKPSTIVHAIKTVYALKPYGKKDKLLRELKDQFVEWAVARGEGWDENAVRCACKKVPAFGEDVRKKHRAAEEGGTEDKDADDGAWEDVDSGSEEDSDSGSEEDSDGSAEEDSDSSAEDSDSNAGEGADDEET